MKILHVCADPKSVDESVCKELATVFFSALAEKNPDVEVTNVDLYKNPPPYLSLGALRCFFQSEKEPGYEATAQEKAAAAYAYEQCEALRQTDILVLTMPLWNCAAPAIMKSWMEHVFVPGQTYDINNDGVQPLHHIRRVILLVSSGIALSENDPADALTPQVRAAFGFIGVDDVQVAWADGQDARFYEDADQRREMATEATLELAEEAAELTQAAV